MEDQVLTEVLSRVSHRRQVFTRDTGRLPQETYDLIDTTRKRYSLPTRMPIAQVLKAGQGRYFARLSSFLSTFSGRGGVFAFRPWEPHNHFDPSQENR